jgi:hypothetical protein
MNATMVSDEVTDTIALIEMHRQEAQKESGLAAACSEALRKLQALLEQERETLRLQGAGSSHSVNLEAINNHIQRVKKMAGAGSGGPGARGRTGHPPRAGAPPQPPRPGGPRGPSKNRGRRAMSRRGR